eukprot:g1572.t1
MYLETKTNTSRNLWSGRLTLLAVAFLWGTYSPSVKFLFVLEGPPTPSTFSFFKALLATGILIGGSLFYRQQGNQETNDVETGAGADKKEHTNDVKEEDGLIRRLLRWNSHSLLWSGVELGFWSTLATFSQTIGISMTSATSAAFLIHSITVFTPLISYFAGDKLKLSGWIGCGASLAGSLIVTLDFSDISKMNQAATTVVVENNSNATMGNFLILCAAIFYAISTVRLGFIADSYKAIELAAAKVTFQFMSSMGWLLIDLGNMYFTGASWSGLWPGILNPAAWITLFWIASGPDALSAVLQNRGQSMIPPSQAQILYASTPIWSALLAGPVLLGDAIQPQAWIGGVLVIVGALFSAA